jgi:cation:H+ antiporter
VIVSVVLLAASLGVILLAAEMFTNSIEWLGRRLNLSEGAVGSVLAAVGTALPETLIPIIAITLGSGAHHDEVGVGAILGAPLMLSTLGFFVTGASVLFFARRHGRPREVLIRARTIGRDLMSFLPAYAVAIGAAFLPVGPPRWAAVAALGGLYAFYVVQTFRRGGAGSEEELKPLYFERRADEPRRRRIVGQVMFSLCLIIVAAHTFVGSLSVVAETMGVSTLVLSLIITPIATELPEKFNSVIWVRQKKDTLALGNMTGAMVFQSSIPPMIGILGTDWKLTGSALAAGGIALIAGCVPLTELVLRKRVSPYTLMAGAAFYGVYLLFAFGVLSLDVVGIAI